jgi:alpha-amylase
VYAGSTQNYWPFPAERVLEGYAYILTHPGMPCIFHDHSFKWGLMSEITALVALRRRHKIGMESKVEILAADADMCAARGCVDERI